MQHHSCFSSIKNNYHVVGELQPIKAPLIEFVNAWAFQLIIASNKAYVKLEPKLSTLIFLSI